MTLLGKAAVAMWWTVRPEQRTEFGDWHAHEHFPERMSIPGFLRGSRWTSTRDADGFFVMYELATYETLSSKGYLDRLNAPTPWSRKMMPHHLGMVRSQCRIEASFGGGIATSLATVRLSPTTGQEATLKASLLHVLRETAPKPGMTGAHLLVTDAPKLPDQTAEQKIRGADQQADWIVLLSGYDEEVVAATVASHFAQGWLIERGAAGTVTTGSYRLAFAMTPQDLSQVG